MNTSFIRNFKASGKGISARRFFILAGLMFCFQTSFVSATEDLEKVAGLSRDGFYQTAQAAPHLTIQQISQEEFQLQFQGEPGRTVIVEVSEDLMAWESAGNLNIPEDGLFRWTLDLAQEAATRFYRVRLEQQELAPILTEISPADGEEMVNVTRETVIRFNEPMDPESIRLDSFRLVANGEVVPGRIVVSSTERFATYFYESSLPASTEVRVVVDGDQIVGGSGVALDADGDGEPGGRREVEFRTLPLTRIAGTDVFGFVRDSFTGEPIEGATIRVDAFPEANAVTDENGRFLLEDMPAPEFFVHVDGSTAVNLPDGLTYPNVGKPFHSVPGQTVQLEMDGEAFDIFLPPMAEEDWQLLSSKGSTDIGFGSDGTSRLEEMFPEVDSEAWDQMQVTIAPNAAVDEEGNVATQGTVIPVPSERLPAPLPPTVDPRLVVSIQANGATNFDVPAPVSFPNLEGLKPGEQSLVTSFNHDAGRWEVVGTATVSEDGRRVSSDPGVGILAPGWHFLAAASVYGKAPPKAPIPSGRLECDKIRELLGKNFNQKHGTPAEALAAQLFCIAHEACQNEEGWGGGFIQDTLSEVARNASKPSILSDSIVPGGVATEALCNRAPTWLLPKIGGPFTPDLQAGDVCAVVSGFGRHFPFELLPSFARNADQLHQDLDNDGRFDHDQFLDTVQNCFDELASAGFLSETAADIAKVSAVKAARLLRETIYNNRNLVKRLSPQAQPHGFVSTASLPPRLPREELFSEALANLGSLTVTAGDSFFIQVGEAIQLKVLRSLESGGTEDITDDPETQYFVLVADGSAEMDNQGLLAVNSTISPLPNATPLLHVVVRNGDDFGLGQFAVVDQDSDADLIVDSFERTIGLDPSRANGPDSDLDGDGLNDLFEALSYLNPLSEDSDGDGISDAGEVERRTSPSVVDYEARPDRYHYVIENLGNDFSIRNTTDASGLISETQVARDSEFRVGILAKSVGQEGGSSANSTALIYSGFTRVDTSGGGRNSIPGQVLDVRTVRFEGGNVVAPAGDSDGDGLTDDEEFILGTSASEADSDGDGITDLGEVLQGLNPQDERAFPTGIIASIPLLGSAQEIVVEPNPGNAGLTAYIATDEYGLAVIDVSQFDRPIALGQLDLPGSNQDIDVDVSRGMAAVAAAEDGLHVVDLSDPMQPLLLRTIATHANQVELVDGLAYVAGTTLQTFDPRTGGQIDEIDFEGSEMTGLAREGTMLFTMDRDLILRAVDIGGFAMAARGAVEVPNGGGKLFVGTTLVDGEFLTVAYAPDRTAGFGGMATVDASDPDNLQVISKSDAQPGGAPAEAVVTNGSGIGLIVGIVEPDINDPTVLRVLDVSDPAENNNRVTDINLPALPFGVAVASGIAFVADGTAGLQVVNYLPFDTGGTPPSVTIDGLAMDVDPDTAGVQANEGASIPIIPGVADDVQVSQVELLIDGQVVATDVSFPWDLLAQLPNRAEGIQEVTLQVRATDTAGNQGGSDPLPVELVVDAVPPMVAGVDPPEGAVRGKTLRTVRIGFSEPMEASTLTPETVRLVGASTSNNVLPPQDFRIRNLNRVVKLTYEEIPPDNYQIVLEGADITDRARNPLGAGPVTSSFVVSAPTAIWVNSKGGFWNDPQNWEGGVLPGPGDDVLIDMPDGATITHLEGETQINSLASRNPFVLSGGTLDVNSIVQIDNTFTIEGGALRNATVVPSESQGPVLISSAQENDLVLDGITWNRDVEIENFRRGWVINGMTINASLKLSLTFMAFREGSSDNLLLDGTGEFVLRESARWSINTKVTIGPKLTVMGISGEIQGSGRSNPDVMLINQGTIKCLEGGLRIIADSANFSNEGLLEAADEGVLRVDFATGDIGRISVTDGGEMQFNARSGDIIGNSHDVEVLGGELAITATEFVNSATINVTNGSLSIPLGENSGTINATDSHLTLLGIFPDLFRVEHLDQVNHTGGTVVVSGLNNEGTTFTVNTNSVWRLDGMITGGTVEGAPLFVDDNRRRIGRLENGTLESEVVIEPAGSFTMVGDSVLNGRITMQSSRPLANVGFTQFAVEDMETLTGTGEIVFEPHPDLGISHANSIAVPVIGPNITIRTESAGGQIGQQQGFINQGTILSDAPDQSVWIRGDENINEGKLIARSGGELRVDNLQPHAGTITAGTGGVLSIRSNFNPTSEGRLTVEIGGTSSSDMGRIEVQDIAQLGGVLNIELVNGFKPAEGDAFEILTFESREGDFETVTGLDLPNNLTFEPTYSDTSLTLTAR